MIYLDNAATSFPKPPAVSKAVYEVLNTLGGSPGRGGHLASLQADRLLFETRELAAETFHISDSSRVVFTSGATASINMALFGLLRPGDRVVTTMMEHNAVTRPLRALEDRGVEVVKVAANSYGFVSPDAIKKACSASTRLLVMTHCSNVCGTLQEIEALGPWCRSRNILFMVDAAQSAGTFALNVESCAIDLLAVPGHKGLMGPPGIGLLYVREGVELTPLMYGGTGGHSSSEHPPEEMPERLESGTHNLPGVAGLKAALGFLKETGQQAILARKQLLMQTLLEGVRGISALEIHGSLDPDRTAPVLCLSSRAMDPSELAFRLEHEFGLLSRAGLQCAPDAHRSLGTFPRGALRISPGYFTTQAEIEETIRALASVVT